MKARFKLNLVKTGKFKKRRIQVKNKFKKKSNIKRQRAEAETKFKNHKSYKKRKIPKLKFKEKAIFEIKKNFKILIIFLLFTLFTLMKRLKYPQDDITLVTSLFNIKSKYKFEKYLTWIDNLLLLNCSIVFFSEKKFLNIIKSKRPKIYEKKTIWIETTIEQFYAYKNFNQNFVETFKLDIEKYHHTIPLYLVWAEKCSFVRQVINQNYFNSKCFYWIDAGFFRKKEEKYFNNWPSTKRCYEDPRVIINGVRNISNEEIEGFKTFNKTIFKKIFRNVNVGGGLFGGKSEYVIKFCDLYYQAIKEFIKHNLFIGKDQNLFAYVSYLNPKIVKIVRSKYNQDWFYFKSYLS